MKRCLTLGISLCLIGLLSGCCCGQRVGFFRGGCGSPCGSPCGQPFGGIAPFGGGCSSCGTGGGYVAPGVAPGYGTPYGAVPSTYYSPYGTAALTPEGIPVETTALPPADGTPVTAYGQPTFNQTTFNQPALGQPAPFAEAPVTTALMKPESLATY